MFGFKIGLFWALGALLLEVSCAEVLLGSLTTRVHGVSGDVYLLGERILEVRNFSYDGLGPAAVFWFDTSATPTAGGTPAADGYPSNGCDSGAALPSSDMITQRVELPAGLTINDFLGGSFGVWCQTASANFGELILPATVDIPQDGPLLECFSNTVTSPPVFIGSLNTREHGVSGDVWLLSDRALEVRSFMYDGQGPATFFWLDTSATPSSSGIVAADGSPSSGCTLSSDGTRLPASRGSTQRVELPEGTTINDFLGGSFSVYCSFANANFGEVVIPTTLEVPAIGPELQCFTSTVTSEPVFLSSFTTRDHKVAGDLWLLSDRVLEVRNYIYDGLGPAAYWWIDTTSIPTRQGRIAADASPSGGCAMTTDDSALPAANGITQRVELPEGTTINDFLGGSLSIWCERFAVNFGEADIPATIDIPSVGPELECFRSPPKNAPIFLGSFSTRMHQVAGDLYLVSDRVLQIRNFVYDGQGPAAYFWIDGSARPSSGGMVVSDGYPSLGCAMSTEDPVLQAANGITQYIELPAGMSIRDYAGGSISVWCERFSANFGEVVIPTSIPFPPNEDQFDCFGSDNDVAPIAMTPAGFNCEPLNAQYQVRWQISGDRLNVELLGRIADGTYMGFGVSGRPQTETWMIGADAVVADITEGGSPRVRDIFMDSRAQCSGGVGVCPDIDGNFANDVSDVSSEQDFGLTLIRYSRPLVPTDVGSVTSRGESADKSIPTAAGIATYIVWAIGPISPFGFPLFHDVDYASRDGNSASLDFGRAIADNCPPLALVGGTSAPTASPPPPFRRPLIGDSDGSVTFDLHIGPSGGPRGYTAITGKPMWGIAWYVNGFLVPKLVLRRGVEYTFRVNGGNDSTDDANYHPFYLTTSSDGGYAQPGTDRLKETPIAGINIIGQNATDVFEYEATLTAPICRYETTDATAGAELGDFEEYFATLDTSCATDQAIVGQAAILKFTPDDTTPDTIYYHCVTHKDLGFEIEVIDADAARVTLSPTSAPGVVPDVGEGFTEVGLTGQLQGGILNFKVNSGDSRAGGADTLTVVLEAPVTGWVGFAINDGSRLMIGSEAVIGLPETGEVKKYDLNQRAVSGVVPMADNRQTLIDASIVQTGSSTILSFTKILVEDGEIPIDGNGKNIFLSAWGSSNRLGVHSAREPFELDLAGGGIGAVESARNAAMWKAHGFLAAFAWALFTPLAITASMVRKCLPGDLWFQIHRAFNALSVTLTITAFIIAVVAISQESPNGGAGHFDSSFADGHRTIGLVILILAVIQATGGLLRPHLPPKPEESARGAPPPEKSAARKGWEIGHRMFGLGIVALCWYQVQLGIMTFHDIWGTEDDEPKTLTAFYVIVTCISGFAIVGFLATFNS